MPSKLEEQRDLASFSNVSLMEQEITAASQHWGFVKSTSPKLICSRVCPSLQRHPLWEKGVSETLQGPGFKMLNDFIVKECLYGFLFLHKVEASSFRMPLQTCDMPGQVIF